MPQSPVQLALAAAVVVAPTFTLPPLPARTVSVHCGVGGGTTTLGAKLAVSVYVPAVPVAEPTVGVHAPVPLHPPVQPDGLERQPVKR